MRRVDADDHIQGAPPPYREAGFWGQLGCALWPRIVDLSSRFNWLNASNHMKHDDGWSIETGLGYYPFQSSRFSTKLRYTFIRQNSPGAEALEPGVVQLLFPNDVGKTSLVTLQLYVHI
jgi:hypothetical protein